MDSEAKIEKLRSKDNWQQWRFVIRTLLEEDENWLKVCDGTLTVPADTDADKVEKLKTFQNADKAARRLICTSIERKPLELILSCTTARDMWQKLSSVYDLKSNENVELVQKQFFNFRWNENASDAFNICQKLSIWPEK